MKIHQELERIPDCPICGWKNRRGTIGSLLRHLKMRKDQKHKELLSSLQ
ncbi:hypothetical protein [Sulfuracidifex tepidarius]|nr:hypothetical protein [Sulfuracidifex tepidarius]